MFRRSTNEYIGIPVNADIMTRNTFKQIFCFLDLADNTYDLAVDQFWPLIIREVSYIVEYNRRHVYGLLRGANMKLAGLTN